MSNLKKVQIANFKSKKGLHTSPSLIYLSIPPGLAPSFTEASGSQKSKCICIVIVFIGIICHNSSEIFKYMYIL